MKVYLLIGGDDYGSSNVLAAYKTSKRAEAELKCCQDHKTKKPPYPEIDPNVPSPECFDTPEWAEHARLEAAWRAALPFKRDFDYYHISEHEVQP